MSPSQIILRWQTRNIPKHIIPHILTELRTKGGVELLENSKKNYRTFLHNEDSCAAVIELAETPEALDGSVYNVATDEEISIIDLVRRRVLLPRRASGGRASVWKKELKCV